MPSSHFLCFYEVHGEWGASSAGDGAQTLGFALRSDALSEPEPELLFLLSKREGERTGPQGCNVSGQWTTRFTAAANVFGLWMRLCICVPHVSIKCVPIRPFVVSSRERRLDRRKPDSLETSPAESGRWAPPEAVQLASGTQASPSVLYGAVLGPEQDITGRRLRNENPQLPNHHWPCGSGDGTCWL